MKKRIGILLLALMFILAMNPAAAVHAQYATAQPSSHTVILDGVAISPTAFNIGGNNFFMLRDIAYMLNGTAAQFEVAWDGALNAINLLMGRSYTPVGGEMAQDQACELTT